MTDQGNQIDRLPDRVPGETYSVTQVRVHDPDRWYAIRYATGGSQPLLIALAAFALELRHIPALVSNAPLGEIRLQWWREALGEIMAYCRKPQQALRASQPPSKTLPQSAQTPVLTGVRAHPVVQELAVELSAFELNRKNGPTLDNIETVLLQTIDARARLLYDDPFESIEDLLTWARTAEGALQLMTAEMVNAELVNAELINATHKAEAIPDASWCKDGAALYTVARHMAHRVAGLNCGFSFDECRDEFIEKTAKWRAAQPSMGAHTLPVFLQTCLIPAYLKHPSDNGFAAIRRHWLYLVAILRGRL